MEVTVKFHTNNPEDMGKLMLVLGTSPIGVTGSAPVTQPDVAQTTGADLPPAASTHPVGDTERQVSTGPTAAQLIAGMTLKPTESSTLGDGTKASPGSYVTFNGEDWHVEATYRGTIVAINEAGKADVIKTSDCKASARVAGAPAAPRAGTAAALLPNETQQAQTQTQHTHSANVPNEPISNAMAASLRETATAKVSAGKIGVEAVFEKLSSFGASIIDELSSHNATLFQQWLEVAGEEPPATDGKFGF